MANIDSLQINISMANKGVIANINDIISALGKLEDKLAVSTSAKDYRSNLNGLAAGFISIGEAINGIDAEKLTTLTKSIGSLSEKMGSVTNIGKSFSNVGVSAANLKEIERLRNEIDKLTEGIEISQEVLDGYREKMAKLNLEIPKEAYREWGDDAKHNRGVIGIRNTHTGSRDTQAVREAFGWEDTFNDTDVYTKLYEILSSLETEIQNDTYKVQSLESEIERLNQAPVDNIVNNAQQISTVGENAGKSLTDFANGLSSLNEIDLSEGQFAGLKTVGNAVKDIASSDLSNVRTQIPQLVEGLNSLQGFVVPNTEGLQATATAIRAFGSKTATRAAEGLPFTVQAISQLSNIQIPNAEGLMSLAQAIGRFGSANAVKASEIMPKLTTELMNMISQLSSAPKVSDNVVRLAEAISQFRGQANASIKSGRNFGNSLNFMGKSVRSARIHFTSLAAVFGSLYANFFLLIRGARLAGKAIDYSSQMTEAMNVVDVAFGKMNGKLKDFLTTSIKDFGLGRLAAAQYASRFQAMGKTLGITAEDVGKANDFILKKTEGNSRAYKDLGNSVADMSVNLTKLTADIASLYNQDYDSVAQDMQAVYTGMTRPLRKYGLDLTMATLKEWALKNGLDADVESMTQAEKTLLRYRYVMSNASIAMGDFAKTADTWANAMRTTKQLLQEFARILGEAFINAFRPALLAFRNFMYNMLDLTQSALNAVGKLLGWAKIDFGGAALAEDMEDYADALDDAAGNAKKLKGQLRGIDELNNLTTNDKGGGGGSGDSGIGYNGADLWENIKETQEKYLSDVTDWRDLGRRIANHLQEGLESIDWHEVYANAMGLGKNSAEFLNGLIKPEAFYDFGKTLAGGIMTAIKTAFSFGSNFDWKNLGNSIAEGINGFFDEFDGGELADTLDVWVQGIFKTMKTAASRVDWKEVFKDMLDFLSHIDLETIEIAAAAVTFVIGANVVRTALTNAIVGALGESSLSLPAITVALAGGLLIGNGIGQIIFQNTDDYGDYMNANPFTNDSELSKATEEFFGTVFDFWKDPWQAITGLTWEEYWKDLFNKAYNLGADLGNKIGEGLKKLTAETKEFWKDPWQAITGESWNEYWEHNGIKTESLLKLFPEIDGNLAFLNIGKMIVEGILKGATDKSGNLSFKALFDNFVAGIKKIFGIASPAKKVYPLGADIALGLIEGIKEVPFLAKLNEWFETNVKPWFSASKWGQLGEGIKSKLSSTLSYSNMWNIGNNMGKGLYDAFKSILDSILTAYKQLKSNIENNPIVQQIVTTSSGSAPANTWVESKDISNQTVIPASVKKTTTPTVTSTAKSWHGLPSKPSGMPTSDWNTYLENWKKNHPQNYYAHGGFPEVGSLFVAGEAGSELVGSINGRTGVASNAEITGIRDAIMQTSSEEMVLLRQQNTLLQGILEKEFGISSDSLFRSVRDSANSFKTRTGRPAF